MNPVRSILRSTEKNQNLNILTVPCHERYESGLCKVPNTDYWSIWREGNKKWNTTYGDIPNNYNLLYNRKNQLPLWLDFDFALAQNIFGQYQFLQPLCAQMQIPLVRVEHTTWMPYWQGDQARQLKSIRGSANVFISNHSVDVWGFKHDDPSVFVIDHTVDTDRFKPSNSRTNRVLTVANDFVNRDYVLGYNLFQRITKGLPTKIVGDTPGLSSPASSVYDLVSEYQQSSVYLNTAHLSPIPTSMLEAMSCLPSGQEILLDYMPIDIEEVYNLPLFNLKTKNDRILKKHKNHFDGNILTIKTKYNLPFRVTDTHPVATVQIYEKYNKELKKLHKKPYEKEISDIEYKEAKDLKTKDYLIVPKLKISKTTELSNQWLRFYGLYLAKGNTNKGNIELSFHQDETHLIEEIKQIAYLLNRKVNVRHNSDTKGVKVVFTHAYLANRLVEMFGRLSSTKQIPLQIMESPTNEAKVFIDAYLEGDGWQKDNKTNVVSSSSKVLSYQLHLLLTKFDILSCLSHGQKPKKGVIKGRTFYGKQQYMNSITPRHSTSAKQYIEDTNNFYVPITSIKSEQYSGPVYNLTTSSNTYCLPTILVHNCGVCPVSLDTCAIPEYITDGENGLLASNESELQDKLHMVMSDTKLAEELGNKARQSIIKKCNIDRFTKEWREVFDFVRIK